MTSALSALSGLIFVLGLIFLTNWLLRRFGTSLCARAGMKSEIVLLETKMLDTKNKLVLFRCRGKDFLILTGQNNKTVATFDAIVDNQSVPLQKEDA